jgi:hypothetical protein
VGVHDERRSGIAFVTDIERPMRVVHVDVVAERLAGAQFAVC